MNTNRSQEDSPMNTNPIAQPCIEYDRIVRAASRQKARDLTPAEQAAFGVDARGRKVR